MICRKTNGEQRTDRVPALFYTHPGAGKPLELRGTTTTPPTKLSTPPGHPQQTEKAVLGPRYKALLTPLGEEVVALQALDWDIANGASVLLSNLNAVHVSNKRPTKEVLVATVVNVDRISVIHWGDPLLVTTLALVFEVVDLELIILLGEDIEDDAGLMQPDTADVILTLDEGFSCGTCSNA